LEKNKPMKRILIILFALSSVVAFAQTEKEIKFEQVDGKYHLKITTSVNGEKQVIDKTYNSLEEMKADPELEGLNLKVFDKGSNAFFFERGSEEGDKNVNVFIRKSEVDADDENAQKFKFESRGDSTVAHHIKVWVDDEGNKRVLMDGEEVDVNNWTDKEGNVIHYKNVDGNIIIKAGDAVGEFITEEGESFDINVKVKQIEDEDGEKVFIFKSGEDIDDLDDKISIKIVKEISLHLEEIQSDEFEDLLEANEKSLKMDEINYFPNPSQGKFTLAFKANSKPTEVNVIGMDGKVVYSEQLSGFEGTYNNEIDLSNEKKGIYLLQILQGKRAYNKKIVIE
jgi:hypothetical protein